MRRNSRNLRMPDQHSNAMISPCPPLRPNSHGEKSAHGVGGVDDFLLHHVRRRWKGEETDSELTVTLPLDIEEGRTVKHCDEALEEALEKVKELVGWRKSRKEGREKREQ